MTGPEHHCPGCGAALKHFPRYPWHFCNDCRKLAATSEGRRLAFVQPHPGGGFAFGLADEEARFEALGIICLIRERPAFVHEARFGGVVAEPLPSLPFQKERVIDVRRGIPPGLVPI